jgi:hypothetical protein
LGWILAGAVVAFVLGGVVQAAESGGDAARLATLQAAGPQASLTVFPFVLGEQPMPQVGAVVAVMMEQSGVEDVGTDETVFRPPEGASLDEIASSFAGFIRDRGIERQYALYGEYLGSPAGVTEIRTVLVDRAGNVVWVDSQAPGDEAFDAATPGNPMACCVFLAGRLKEAMALPDLPPGAERKAGKLEREMSRKSGVPEESESEAMKERQREMADRRAEASIIVYPVRVRNELNREQAEHLAALLGTAGFTKVEVAGDDLPIEVPPDRSQLKMLWSLARSFQEHVRAEPPEADYALYADYLMVPPDGPVGGVHVVVCDRTGEWVIVDLQNSHHEDFQAIKPTNAGDCTRLAAKRFAGYLD